MACFVHIDMMFCVKWSLLTCICDLCMKFGDLVLVDCT